MRFGKFTPSHLPPPRTKGENKVSIGDSEGPKPQGPAGMFASGIIESVPVAQDAQRLRSRYDVSPVSGQPEINMPTLAASP
jgi:hypothetical protein